MNRIARGIARDIALSTWKCTQAQDKACKSYSYYTVFKLSNIFSFSPTFICVFVLNYTYSEIYCFL